MKMLIVAAMAASAITAIAVPAMAQPYGPPPPQGDWHDHDRDHGRGPGPVAPETVNIDQRMNWIQTRINTGRQDGSLNRHEFYSVQRRLNDIKRDVVRERYQDGGQLSGPDRQRLEGRLDQLNDSIRWARHNDNQRPW